jgi:HSP20 family protein
MIFKDSFGSRIISISANQKLPEISRTNQSGSGIFLKFLENSRTFRELFINKADSNSSNINQRNSMVFTLFDDIDRQMMEMIKALHHPSFGRIEPPECPSPSRETTTRRQYPFMRARMDLIESPTSYKVIVELPGVKKEAIKVSVDEGNILNIEAEQNEAINKEEDKVHYSERRYGTIKRSVTLPQGASADKVKANFNDGLLELEFPKSQKEASKLISIS